MKKSTKTAKPAAPQVKKSAIKKTVEPKPAAAKKAAPVPVKKVVAPKPTPAPAPAKKVVAKKAAPVKKAAAPVKKAAPAKKVVATKAAVAKATPPSAVATTVITARVDVGFGNALSIRGDGPSLSWDAGVPLSCVSDDEWSITLSGGNHPIAFKFLINDEVWSEGEDYSILPGASSVFAPKF